MFTFFMYNNVMNSMSDEYYSRLLTFARQNKDVKSIKEIKDNKLLVELSNGTQGRIDWSEVVDFKEIIK